MEVKEQLEQLKLKELIAMGVGGMIGGGIFSVLGLAAGITGHATPVAFLLGGVLALIAGYSYIRLSLAFRSDGASFTYLEHAFPKHPNIGGITGWVVVIGYIGTMALYAFTFGAYGAELLSSQDQTLVRQFLSVSVILFFMIVNLHGAKSSGRTEDLIVYSKIALLGLLAVAGLRAVEMKNLAPMFNRGVPSVFMAGALIFVAYEGFQLITNAVCETDAPERNIPRGIYGSIAVVTAIYVLLSIIAIGGLSLSDLIEAKEYALAVAAEPALGNAGRVLVSIAALLATSSAVNATMFGASRMMAEIATEKEMPKAFSFRNRVQAPWLALVTMSVLTVFLTYFGGLELIAAFSSMTFLLVSIAVSVANLKLRSRTNSNVFIILIGTGLMLATVITLVVYLWENSPTVLIWIGSIYAAVVASELLFSKRSLIHRLRQNRTRTA